MGRYTDIRNKRFNKLVVLNEDPKIISGRAHWRCRCDCGTEKFIASDKLTRNKTVSCGCKRSKYFMTHGNSGEIWYKREIGRRYKHNRSVAMPNWADVESIRDIYKNCPVGYHVDHIIPLNNSLVCGLHVPENLQYLPASDNISKSNKFSVIHEIYD